MLRGIIIYATVAYVVTLAITLIRLIHFFYKFRVANHREVATVIVMMCAPHILFSLLTFPLEVTALITRRQIIYPKYAYEIACAAFNMRYQQLHFAYRVRHYEKSDLYDF